MSNASSSDTQSDMSGPNAQPPSRSMPVATTSRVTLEHAASNEDAPTNKRPAAITAITATGTENLPSTTTKAPTSFAQLGVERFLCNALRAMSIRQPTEVQAACIPPILAGSDCIGSAQTGSGKTIAFALPIMQDLAKDPHGFFALVLTPTRELAFQISEQFRVIGAAVNLHSVVIVGGMDMMAQAIELRKRPHVIIATPGRLVDLIRSNKDEWSLGKIKYLVSPMLECRAEIDEQMKLKISEPGPDRISSIEFTQVLDEADRLLTPTFAPDLAFLVDQLPAQRQSLLFTATLTEPVMALQKRPTVPGKAPPFIHVSRNVITTPAGLVQRYLFIPSQVREVYLVYLLLNLCDLTGAQPVQARMDASTLNHKMRGGERPLKRTKRTSSPSAEEALTPRLPQTILFVPHCRTAALFTSLLGHLPNPIPCTALHSHLSQPERLQSLSSFRRQQVPLLIATDVGSRGLDIPEVEVVLNWEVPRVPDDYVHRVGRTARAGRKGTSITVVTEGDVELVQALEQRINTKLHELELPEEAVLELLSAVSMAKRMGNMELADGFGKRQETNRKKNAILQSHGADAKSNAGNKSLVGKHKRGKTVKAAVV